MSFLLTQFTPLETGIRAQTPDQAWAQAIRGFDLLLATLNLQDTWHRHFWQVGMPRALGRVRQPPIYGLFEKAQKEATWYFTRGRLDYSGFSAGDRDWSAVKKTLRRLREIQSDEIRQLITDALIKYGEAVATGDPRHAFLELWQILEMLALQSEGNTNMRDVGERISLLLGQKQEDRDLLAALADTRNEFVHTGRYPDEHGFDEMQALKGIVERAIDVLSFKWARKLESRQSLRLLYSLLALGDQDLGHRAKVISVVQASRRIHGHR